MDTHRPNRYKTDISDKPEAWYDKAIAYIRVTPKRAAIVLGIATLAAISWLAFDSASQRPDWAPLCNYTVQEGDNLSDLCESEGFEGRNVQRCIDIVCEHNRYNGMPDNPTFDQDDPSCGTMFAGSNLVVPDYNRDGEFNGQRCGE